MQAAYNILLFISIMIAIVFTLLVLFTGKGDAMSGGGSVRTTFKGKASFDDFISRWTLVLGVSFFVLMLLIDGVSNRIDLAKNASSHSTSSTTTTPAPASSPNTKTGK